MDKHAKENDDKTKNKMYRLIMDNLEDKTLLALCEVVWERIEEHESQNATVSVLLNMLIDDLSEKL